MRPVQQSGVDGSLDRALGPSSTPPAPSSQAHHDVVPAPGEAPGNEGTPTTAHTAAAGQRDAGIDLEQLVERALRSLMFRLDIERERRGYARWS